MIRFLINTPDKRIVLFMLTALSVFTPILEYLENGSIGNSYLFAIMWIPYLFFSYLEYKGIWK